MPVTVNPHAGIKFVRDDTGITAIRIEAPRRRTGLAVTTIDRGEDAGLFGFFLIYSATANAEAALGSVSDAERARLCDIGFLVPDDQVSDAIFYECDVETWPRDLLPARARAHSAADVADARPETLVPDPTLRLIGPGGPPPEMRGRYKLASPFRADRSWFSVDSDAAAPTFFSSGDDVSAHLAAVAAGTTTPDRLPPAVRESLARAGVLRHADAVAHRRARRASAIATARARLHAERHVVLPEAIQPIQLAAIRHYYRALLDQGFVRYGDAEWPHRYFASRDPLAYFFQQQLTDLVSDVAGERLKPSFCFFTSYRPGADLPAHVDREQCSYAMSVLLDHGQPDDISEWPIYVQPPGAPDATPVHAALGDGLLYFGEEVLHYRHPLTAGFSTLWFLFWVPEAFSNSLD